MSEPTAAVGRRPLGTGRPAVLASVLVVALVAFGIVASAYLAGGRLVEADAEISEWVAATMPAFVEWGARALSWIGGIAGVTFVAAFAVGLLWLRARIVEALLVAVAAVGVQVLVLGLKHAFERPRPTTGSPIDVPGSFSFPSGHAATGIAVFGLLGVLAGASARSTRGRAAWIVAGSALGVAIGASRVALNVHYASDVLAGYLVGLAWLVALLLARELAARRQAGRGGR